MHVLTVAGMVSNTLYHVLILDLFHLEIKWGDLLWTVTVHTYMIPDMELCS